MIAEARRRQLPALALYAVAISFGVLLVPRVAAFAYLVVAVGSVAVARGDRAPGRARHREG